MANKPHILFVDDNHDDVEIACWHLSKAGVQFVCEWVFTEETFRSALSTASPDLIVCDFHLPGFDGLAALRIAQSMTSSVPIVFYTGGGFPRERCDVVEALGAYGCVDKDDFEGFIDLVERALNSVAVQGPQPLRNE